MTKSSRKSELDDAVRAKPWRVAVIAFDGISPFHLSVPCLVFGEDRRS